VVLSALLAHAVSPGSADSVRSYFPELTEALFAWFELAVIAVGVEIILLSWLALGLFLGRPSALPLCYAVAFSSLVVALGAIGDGVRLIGGTHPNPIPDNKLSLGIVLAVAIVTAILSSMTIERLTDYHGNSPGKVNNL
jgi:hypothetical protein